jgi:hypothetical protein
VPLLQILSLSNIYLMQITICAYHNKSFFICDVFCLIIS